MDVTLILKSGDQVEDDHFLILTNTWDAFLASSRINNFAYLPTMRWCEEKPSDLVEIVKLNMWSMSIQPAFLEAVCVIVGICQNI